MQSTLAAQYPHTDPSSNPPPGHAVLLRVADGDWQAYTALFEYYLPRLSQYIYPFTKRSIPDTEEVIQEVFLKIWEKRAGLAAVKSFDHYLYRMAKNKVLDLLKIQYNRGKIQLAYSALRDTSTNGTEEKLVYTEYHEIAQKAIELLSPKLQEVFMLSTQSDLSLDEIAEKLQIPKETVKKRLYLANTSIKNYLRNHAEWLGLLIFCWPHH